MLWENVENVRFADWGLIQLYMGWRPQELATLRLDAVHLDEWYIQAGMDEYALKLIVGHSIQDITEAVYTERDIEWLRTDIEKLK